MDSFLNTMRELREQIDSIDDQIVALLNKRAGISLKVRDAKSEFGLDSYVPTREKEVLDRVMKLSDDGAFPKNTLARIFGNILSSSRFLQGEHMISYLGPKGSHAFNAALQSFGSNAVMQPETSIADVFHKVSSGLSHYGVVPLEIDSTGIIGAGIVGETLDCFMAHNLRIVNEIVGHTKLLLLANPILANAVGLDRIKRVMCDSCYVAMVERWMSINLPSVVIEISTDIDYSIKMATEHDDITIIGTENVAELYGLTCIAKGIEANRSRYRYVVIGNSDTRDNASSGNDKTSILCIIFDKPGALLQILEPFAKAGITLTKIESRSPSEVKHVDAKLKFSPLGHDCFFFVDILGHINEPIVAQTIEELRKLCSEVRLLGSYPMVNST